MKNSWRIINDTLSKNKRSSEMPSTFSHNGKELTDPTEIANAFNTHFVNIGKTLASEIVNNIPDNADYTQYLNTPSVETCKFECVAREDIMRAIDNLENKNSSGHDGISNKILKYIKYEISNSLTLIINQMMTTGIFPDAFKKSKITPIFKKGESSLLINYRLISLLPTISKGNKLKFLMYADDTTIYFNLDDFDQNCLETDINNELEKVNLWLKLNKLYLNTQKTKLMVFHRKQKKIREIHLSIHDIQIEQVPTFNFLGITLNENLSWKNHTKMVVL